MSLTLLVVPAFANTLVSISVERAGAASGETMAAASRTQKSRAFIFAVLVLSNSMKCACCRSGSYIVSCSSGRNQLSIMTSRSPRSISASLIGMYSAFEQFFTFYMNILRYTQKSKIYNQSLSLIVKPYT